MLLRTMTYTSEVKDRSVCPLLLLGLQALATERDCDGQERVKFRKAEPGSNASPVTHLLGGSGSLCLDFPSAKWKKSCTSPGYVLVN
jgi:hypothetical protein